MSVICTSRRQLLGSLGGIAVASILPTQAFASRSTNANNLERSLSFYNLHTGERSKGTFWEKGHYVGDTLDEFSHVLRDHRQNIAAPMDKRLYELLFNLQDKLEVNKEFHVISAYRSPKTNQMLANKSNGVAKKSYHMKAMAMDIAMPGVDLKHLRNAALSLKLGGVGYYPRDGFIHVDCGPVRNW